MHDGPCFARPVPVTVGETVTRDGRYYADLVFAGVGGAGSCLRARRHSAGVRAIRSMLHEMAGMT